MIARIPFNFLQMKPLIRLNRYLFQQKMHPNNHFKVTPFISLYAITHLVVDASCAYMLLGVLELNDNAIVGMLTYNAVAFVLQAPFGLLIDKILNPKLAAMVGLTFVAISFLFWNNLFAALIIISVGNALYHVGGGSLVLSLEDKKATFSGIYVAPGAIGLAIGSFLSISRLSIHLFTFPIILLFLGGFIYFVNAPEFIREKENSGKIHSSYGIFLIVLIMIPIAVRSLIGLSVDFPWKQNHFLLYTLIAALFFGKIVGGILADKYGLIKTGIVGLLISIPLLSFYSFIPILGIIGAFTFNFTMPVTLIAISNILPQKKGLSFGLTTVAIFIGSLPAILGNNTWFENDFTIFAFILLSTIILYLALIFLGKLKMLKA